MTKFKHRIAMSLLVAVMTGCATNQKTAVAVDDMLAPLLDVRVIDCVLTFLAEQGIEKAELRYQYVRGATSFHTTVPGLTAYLEECASTSDGPNVTFEREIEVWAADAQ